jgi:hypothetical protein
VFGIAADYLGAARTLLIGCAMLLVAVYALYFGLAAAPQQLDLLYPIAGFCVGVVGVIPTVLVGAFPPAIRFSGIAFAYNLAYAIFGGLTPLFLSWLLPSQPMIAAHYVAALCVVGGFTALIVNRQRSANL